MTKEEKIQWIINHWARVKERNRAIKSRKSARPRYLFRLKGEKNENS